MRWFLLTPICSWCGIQFDESCLRRLFSTSFTHRHDLMSCIFLAQKTKCSARSRMRSMGMFLISHKRSNTDLSQGSPPQLLDISPGRSDIACDFQQCFELDSSVECYSKCRIIDRHRWKTAQILKAEEWPTISITTLQSFDKRASRRVSCRDLGTRNWTLHHEPLRWRAHLQHQLPILYIGLASTTVALD